MTPSRYRPPVAKREPQSESPGLPRLPPGRHGLPRDFVVQNQRDRLAAGIIAAVSEFGYHETTITQIAGAAGVSRRTFYGYFDSKEECFFETFDQIADHLRDASREAAAAREPMARPGRRPLRRRARGLLHQSPARPLHARRAAARGRRGRRALPAGPRRGARRAHRGDALGRRHRAPSDAVQHSLIGGAASLIVQKLEAGEGDRIDELLPDLVELFLTPFVGRAEAVAAVARQAAERFENRLDLYL